LSRAEAEPWWCACITLDGDDDRVVAADTVAGDADSRSYWSSAENGMGKAHSALAYRSQGRGGKGLKTMDLNSKTGSLVVSCVLPKEDEANLRLMIVTQTASSSGCRYRRSSHTGALNPGGPAVNLNDGDHVKNGRVPGRDKEDGGSRGD